MVGRLIQLGEKPVQQAPKEFLARIAEDAADFPAALHQDEGRGVEDRPEVLQVRRAVIVDVDAAQGGQPRFGGFIPTDIMIDS